MLMMQIQLVDVRLSAWETVERADFEQVAADGRLETADDATFELISQYILMYHNRMDWKFD